MTKEDREIKGLLKIGELAREAEVPVSTIRYYTEIGLLKVLDFTESGYRLYRKSDTIEVLNMVKVVNEGKSTLNEIRTGQIISNRLKNKH